MAITVGRRIGGVDVWLCAIVGPVLHGMLLLQLVKQGRVPLVQGVDEVVAPTMLLQRLL